MNKNIIRYPFYLSAAVPALWALKQKGKKEGGWGGGIFARPRFPIPFFSATGFRTSETGAPPILIC